MCTSYFPGHWLRDHACLLLLGLFSLFSCIQAFAVHPSGSSLCHQRQFPRQFVFIRSRSETHFHPIRQYAAKQLRDTVVSVPSPLDKIIEVDKEKGTVIFELSFVKKDLGFEILQGMDAVYVGKVVEGSRASLYGLQPGDVLLATSATAGELMWFHQSAESVKSALSTRFIMNQLVKIRFSRKLDLVDERLWNHIKLPVYSIVKLKRPLGLSVVEGPDKSVIIQYIDPDGGAAKSRRLAIGDQIVAMSASWGDKLWEVHNVESFVVGVKMRSDQQLTFKARRVVTLSSLLGLTPNAVRSTLADATEEPMDSKAMTRVPSAAPSLEVMSVLSNSKPVDVDQIEPEHVSLSMRREAMKQQIAVVNSESQARGLWLQLLEMQQLHPSEPIMNINMTHALMMKAREVEAEPLALEVFETVFDFKRRTSSVDGNHVAMQPIRPCPKVAVEAIVCYSRCNDVNSARAVLRWLENDHQITADVYVLAALLSCYAKHKCLQEAERLFWEELPSRNIDLNIVCANIMIHAYAKSNRAEDALRVYDLIKEQGLVCTAPTYGALIKALLRSRKRTLISTAVELLQSLPNMGITPTVEIFNQFLEFYSLTHNHKAMKQLLSFMRAQKPAIKPDRETYQHFIRCYSEVRQPRMALSAYRAMQRQGLKPNAQIYMSILRSLAHMRNGLAAIQALGQMIENKIQPTTKHFGAAMFACLLSGQYKLAEDIIALYQAQRPPRQLDEPLCAMWLRALLHQNKWTEAQELLKRMGNGSLPKAETRTFNYLLQFQIVAEKYSDALGTLRQMTAEYSREMRRVGKEGKMKDVFWTLSFALGPYSAYITRRHKADITFGNTNYLPVRRASNDDSPDSDEKTVGGIEREDPYATISEFPAVGVNQTSSAVQVVTPLIKPSPATLEFLMQSVHLISEFRNVLFPSSFYSELLKAFIVEKQPELVAELMLLRSTGQIRVRFRGKQEEDSARNVETLANRALQSGLMKSARR